ncbi:hypothetical protein BHM03_00060072, partial [Ensete ventricosum]
TMVADIYWKMVAERYELEGNSDDRGRRGQQQRRLQLRCDFEATCGVGCSKGVAAIEDGEAMYMAVVEAGNDGIE